MKKASGGTNATVPEMGSSKEPAKRRTGGIEELTLEKIKGNSELDLSTLVGELTLELGYKRDRVLSRLIQLEAGKKIAIKEKIPYRSFPSYAASPAALWFWGAVVATLISLALIGVTGGAAIYLRYIFGGLLILFLPGYSLVELLYAKKKELDGLTRAALSIGLSLALVPLIGLVLNYTPFGIRLIPVVVSLALFTVVALVLALKRKHAYYKISRDVVF